jgi:hypothetical protein
MQTTQIIALIALTVFSVGFFGFIFFDEYSVAKRNVERLKKYNSRLIKELEEKNSPQDMNQQQQNQLQDLIAASKGKFFSIQFTKNDGTTKVVNGKDKYRRLLAGGNNSIRQHGFVPFVDRNRENWACAHKDKVVTFKCGKLVKEFHMA